MKASVITVKTLIAKSGNWLATNIGVFGMWGLLFMGMLLIYEGFDIRDELATNRKNEKAIADGYNKGIKGMNELLSKIQEEEGTRLSGDSEFTRIFKQRVQASDERFTNITEGLNYLLTKAGATPLPLPAPTSYDMPSLAPMASPTVPP